MAVVNDLNILLGDFDQWISIDSSFWKIGWKKYFMEPTRKDKKFLKKITSSSCKKAYKFYDGLSFYSDKLKMHIVFDFKSNRFGELKYYDLKSIRIDGIYDYVNENSLLNPAYHSFQAIILPNERRYCAVHHLHLDLAFTDLMAAFMFVVGVISCSFLIYLIIAVNVSFIGSALCCLSIVWNSYSYIKNKLDKKALLKDKMKEFSEKVGI